jgi:hypothetical protein
MLRPPRVADPRPTCTVAEAVPVRHCTPYSSSVRLSRCAELNAVKTDLSVQYCTLIADGRGTDIAPLICADFAKKKTRTGMSAGPSKTRRVGTLAGGADGDHHPAPQEGHP